MRGRLGDKVRLQHALEAIEIIESYVLDANFEMFLSNAMLRDACIRQLQVIGEACGKISTELRTQHSDIPWRQIVGLRIIVVHQYFGIDEKVIWDVIRGDLPVLKGKIKYIISTKSE